jgi:diguanylate cyclase (GGDEF)-like protein
MTIASNRSVIAAPFWAGARLGPARYHALQRSTPSYRLAKHPSMFNLSRYFSLLSLVLIVLAGLVLGYFYYRLSLAQLMDMAQDRNLAMTQVFRNTLWPRHGEFLRQGGARDAQALRDSPEIARVHGDMSIQMRGTDIIKAKVFNRDGFAMYSSDFKQIGEDKSGNSGYREALSGRVASELTRRTTLDEFEGVVSRRDLISSYMPIRNADGAVEGVLQLDQDVTPFLADVRQTLWRSVVDVLAVFGLLYGAQFLVVRRAHRILRQQQAQLYEANRDLDARVAQRTQDLERANRSLEQEVTERRAAEGRLDHLAHHDLLTGLPNRLSFNEHLERRLKRAERHGQQLAVMFIDLDQFKDVNDSLGHAVGDELLKIVASRLTRDMRSEDVLARLGGDEFICLVEEMRTPADAGTVALKFIESLRAPFKVSGHDLTVSASLGISVYPDDGTTVDMLVRNADTAMYRAKARGRNMSQFYAPEMTAFAMERLRLESLLRRSIGKGEMSLHYQPQVDSVGGILLGAEALARWNSPELGQVPPTRFIPVAEEAGFILVLGEWVLREACRQVAEWDSQGWHLPKISVNVSARQVERTDLLAVVRAVCLETGLAPDRIELELTESVIMASDKAMPLMEGLRAMGVKLSVDDFGTGYSSLAYLNRLPISKLKIDRAFVVGIGENRGDEMIIHTIVALARNLGLDLIAEGVETAGQAAFLAGAGCPHVQGYLHGRPLAAGDFSAMLAKQPAPLAR